MVPNCVDIVPQYMDLLFKQTNKIAIPNAFLQRLIKCLANPDPEPVHSISSAPQL